MSPTLLYLLKANVALLLFAAAYFGLLRRLTFFTLNRFYLLVAVLFSAVYPVLPLPALFPEAAGLPVVVEVLATTGGASGAAAAPVAAPIDWEAGGLVLYVGGAAVLLARLLVQLLSLWRVRRTSRPALVHGHPVRTLTGAISPFSFWQTVYLNPARHPAAELAAVLRHEQVHVRQWHTLDVLLAQLLQALAWCNPAAWLLRRAVLDNLEYLADHAALQTGLDRQAYQYSLLLLSRGAAGPSLVSHFTFPTLKNRVAMMNTPLSSTGQLARYIVAGPLVLAVALGFSAAQAQGAGPVVPASVRATIAANNAATPSLIYFVDGQRSNELVGDDAFFASIATLKVLRSSQVQQALGDDIRADEAHIITTNKNRNRADVLALNKKVDAAGAQDMHLKVELGPAKNQLPVGIKAYIAKTYPAAKLTSWVVSDKASPKAPYVRYLAGITEGNTKRMLYFNAEEQPVTPAPEAPSQSRQTERSPRAAAGVEVMSTPATMTDAPSRTATPAPTLQTQVSQGEPPIVYLDGRLQKAGSNPSGLVNPQSVASIHINKGERASHFLGGAPAPEAGIVVITTLNNQHRPEVVAFNKKAGISLSPAALAAIPAGEYKPQSTAYLAAPAMAYITKTYPDARLLEVSEDQPADGSATRYKALIAVGRRPVSLLFDAQGQFISELPYTAR